MMFKILLREQSTPISYSALSHLPRHHVLYQIHNSFLFSSLGSVDTMDPRRAADPRLARDPRRMDPRLARPPVQNDPRSIMSAPVSQFPGPSSMAAYNQPPPVAPPLVTQTTKYKARPLFCVVCASNQVCKFHC